MTLATQHNSIDPQELHRILSGEGSCQLVDVRTAAEVGESHIDGALHVPLDRLSGSDLLDRLDSDCQIALICKSGARSAKAAEKLAAAGFSRHTVLNGGLDAWRSEGLPVVEGTSKVMPLERQVRIAAGLLVVVGAVLGFALHPGWHGISAFVGAGLVFAGVTDTCGMAMLIARMPWNQRA